MVRCFGRKQRHATAVHPYLVKMTEVWVTTLLACVADEVDDAILLVDASHLRDVPFPAGDLRLQLSCRQIIQVELAPVITFGKPDHLIRRRQHVPVDQSVARLELRCDIFPKNVAYSSGAGVGDPKHFVLVVARSGDERHLRAVRIPLDIDPWPGSSANDVIAERRAMCVRRHLEANHARGVDVYYDAMNHRDRAVPRKGILPRLQRLVADSCVDQVHLTERPIILLERRNLAGIRRPDDDWPIASHPARVVSRVTKVFRAVGRQLRLPARCNVAHPQVVVANEGCLGAVGRDRFRAATWTTLRRSLQPRYLARIQRPAASISIRIARDATATRRIDENDSACSARWVAISDPIAREPNRLHPDARDIRQHTVHQKSFAAGVVGCSHSRLGFGVTRAQKQKTKKNYQPAAVFLS